MKKLPLPCGGGSYRGLSEAYFPRMILIMAVASVMLT